MRRSGTSQLPDPPDAPETTRRIVLPARQWAGLLALFAIPALALTGLLGERQSSAEATAGPIVAAVRSPDVLRYRTTGTLSLNIRNRTDRRIDTVLVRIDTTWTVGFSKVRAIPGFRRAYEIAITDLGAAGQALVRVEVIAERYGRHEGRLHVFVADDSLQISLATRILP